MTTGNTTLLGLALPVEGELDGTWGDVVNDSITSLVDSAVAGTTTLSADADVTLTTTVLAANQARQAILRWTASNGATTRNITAPAQSKPYIVINAGTGSIVLRGAGPTTGITIVAGERCVAAWSDSDFVKVATSATSTGTVTAVSVASANGFTGTSSGGATPSLTLATSITGVLKGNGTAISAASAGTDYVAPGGALGTPSSGALTNCTADGTNAVGYRNIPPVGTKTSSYTLATADIGKYVLVGTGGSIVIPNSTFAAGDVVSIVNGINTTITITCSISSAFVAGNPTAPASMTLAARGVATVLFTSGTVCVVSGNVS
jgi:hypothetical protein